MFLFINVIYFPFTSYLSTLLLHLKTELEIRIFEPDFWDFNFQLFSFISFKFMYFVLKIFNFLCFH